MDERRIVLEKKLIVFNWTGNDRPVLVGGHDYYGNVIMYDLSAVPNEGFKWCDVLPGDVFNMVNCDGNTYLRGTPPGGSSMTAYWSVDSLEQNTVIVLMGTGGVPWVDIHKVENPHPRKLHLVWQPGADWSRNKRDKPEPED